MGKGGRQKRESGKRTPEKSDADRLQESSPIPANTIILAGIFVLGLFLRIFELARKSLWLDEASTYYLTTQPDIAAIFTAASRDHHAPLHFVTIWAVRAFGSSEFLLRLPSAVAGALTILVVYFIAKELYSDNAGLIAATLLAVSPYHILYSQEARMYGMAVLFVSLAVWMFLRGIRTGELRDWLFFGCACALAFNTHFYTAFAIIALAIAYFIIRYGAIRKAVLDRGKDPEKASPFPADLKWFVAGMALSFILVLPVLGSFFNQSGYFVAGSFNWGLSMWNIPSQTFLMFSFYQEIAAVIFFVLLLAGLFLIWQRSRALAAAVATIFILPVIFSMYLSQIIPFNVRYHLFLIVIFFAIVAIPLAYLAGKISLKFGTGAIILIIALLSLFPLSAYYTESFQDWRAASATLGTLTEQGDTVVPLPWNNYLPMSYYYNNATDGTYYRNFELSESGFKTLDKETGSVYFVITLGDLSAKGEPAFSTSMAYLDTHAKVLSGSSMYDILIAKKTS